MTGPVDGLVLLDKPEGVTSFAALGCVKRALGTRRVGHTGTLDRFAAGLLVAVTGRYTRLASLVAGGQKSYRARFRFGLETDTLDPEGQVVATAAVPEEPTIRRAVQDFVGDLDQVPPVYSAVHYGGERAHRLVRQGRPVDLAARRITVHRFEILGYEPPHLDVEILCSTGTYVRALARDIGAACGSRAMVLSLVRTGIGAFRLSDAVRPEAFRPDRDLLRPREFLRMLKGVPLVEVAPGYGAAVGAGLPLRPEHLAGHAPASGDFLVTDGESNLLAVATAGEEGLRYRAVFPPDPREPSIDAPT